MFKCIQQTIGYIKCYQAQKNQIQYTHHSLSWGLFTSSHVLVMLF